LDYVLTKRILGTHRKDKASELVLIVSCNIMQSDMVEKERVNKEDGRSRLLYLY
jgi:hypothetical protein